MVLFNNLQRLLGDPFSDHQISCISAQTRHMTWRTQSVHRCDLCVWRRDHGRRKHEERNLTMANWTLAQTTYVVGWKSNFARGIVHGSSFSMSSFVKICKEISEVSGVAEWSKCALSHIALAFGLYYSLYRTCKLWIFRWKILRHRYTAAMALACSISSYYRQAVYYAPNTGHQAGYKRLSF